MSLLDDLSGSAGLFFFQSLIRDAIFGRGPPLVFVGVQVAAAWLVERYAKRLTGRHRQRSIRQRTQRRMDALAKLA